MKTDKSLKTGASEKGIQAPAVKKGKSPAMARSREPDAGEVKKGTNPISKKKAVPARFSKLELPPIPAILLATEKEIPDEPASTVASRSDSSSLEIPPPSPPAEPEVAGTSPLQVSSPQPTGEAEAVIPEIESLVTGDGGTTSIYLKEEVVEEHRPSPAFAELVATTVMAATLEAPGVAAHETFAESTQDRPSAPNHPEASSPDTEPSEPALPRSYGTGSLWVDACEPNSLHASWDFSETQRAVIKTESLGAAWRLRVYLHSSRDALVHDIMLPPDGRDLFIGVPQAGLDYFISLGYEDIFGIWVPMASCLASTPSSQTASPSAVTFASVLPPNFARADEDHPRIPLSVEPLSFKPSLGQGTAHSSPWTIESGSKPAAPIRAEANSEALPDLMSQTVFNRSVSAAAVLAVERAEASSPAGGEDSEQGLRGPGSEFWFQVNAEVVVYGATVPGASVQFSGRPIKLRPDGTFSFRFTLPDGSYALPISATSRDGVDSRYAELRIDRTSAYSGPVGRHPQDAKLKPPG